MTIKANDALAEAQRVIEQYDGVRLSDIAGMPSNRVRGITHALAVLRPETAHVDPPKRAISDMDARVLATTVRAHLELVDTLHGTLGTSGFDADVRDRLERLLLTLDA